jgi:gamma-tubulin complex component 5
MFVYDTAERIFITGKRVVFLHRLSEHGTLLELAATMPTPAARLAAGQEVEEMTLRSAYAKAALLAPFVGMFATALERWIAIHHSLSSQQRNILHANYGRRESLETLEHVFLCRDGHRFVAFARAVFKKVDRVVVGWDDMFLLTELVQGLYSGMKCVHA